MIGAGLAHDIAEVLQHMLQVFRGAVLFALGGELRLHGFNPGDSDSSFWLPSSR